jgi:murein DD-endopeptidase MepM/ murein hydrolase activator NlpD
VFLYGNYQPFGHAGQDIACPIGTPVRAIAAGTVIWADWGTNLPGDDSDAGYRKRWYMYKNFPGIVTLIQHDGWISMYGHLSSNDDAPVGSWVSEGQVIGKSGNTKAPGVTLGAHLHVGALVDLSYACSGGLIYGCTNPEPFYTAGDINTQSATITPVQEDDLTPEERATLFSVLDKINTNVAALPQPQYWNDLINAVARVDGSVPNIPAAVLNQTFPLGDGTYPNLAGLLSAIYAKPAAVTNVASAPFDVDALVARLKAELPTAVIAELTAKLVK